MANKVFSSYSTGKNKDAANGHLIVEAGAAHLACMVVNERHTIKEFELFKTELQSQSNFETLYADVLSASSLLNKTYSHTKLFINNETSLFVPSANYSKESSEDYLNLVYGEKSGMMIVTDHFVEESFYNIYRAEPKMLEVLSSKFNIVATTHTCSNIAEQVLKKPLNPELLKVVFYSDSIIAVLLADSKLQFIQTFSYQSSNDILYYLLSLGQRFNLRNENILLQVSGRIDVKTPLFNDLKKNFKRIAVEEPDLSKLDINFGDITKHYFTPFFNLAK